jgi:hypothetical protein
VRVDVVIGEVAVLALADDAGQFTQSEQIGVVVQVDAVLEGEPLTGLDLFADAGQMSVGVRLGHGCLVPWDGGQGGLVVFMV